MGRKLMIYKPLPGERKIFPNSAMPVCPYCAKELELNLHPKERWLPVVGIGPILILVAAHSQSNSLFFLGTVVLGLSVVALIYLQIRYFRNWPRFKERSRNAL